MRIKYKYITGHPDIKDQNGYWIKSFRSGDFIQTKTRSVDLWNAVKNRTRAGGSGQRNCISYEGCVNNFESYQDFTEWCQDQYGYMLLDTTGRFWQLDKDILVLGNEAYGPETCMFVPTRVNNLFITRERFRGEYPLGVYLSNKNTNLYTGRISVNKETRFETFYSAEDAHIFWQKGKIEALLKMADLDAEVVQHTKLRSALKMRAQLIQDDIDNERETFRL